MNGIIANLLAALARMTSGANVRWMTDDTRDGQVIYFANHTSHLDFVVLWSVLGKEQRPRTRPVAARDYWEATGVRRYFATRIFRAILVDREGESVGHLRAQLTQLIEALDAGDSLILFPEGTRGTSEGMAEFRGGLYFLARQRPDLGLVPVHLHNLQRIMPKGEFLPVPQLSAVTFGAPLRLEKGEGKEAFLARARTAIEELAPS